MAFCSLRFIPPPFFLYSQSHPSSFVNSNISIRMSIEIGHLIRHANRHRFRSLFKEVSDNDDVFERKNQMHLWKTQIEQTKKTATGSQE